MYRHRCVCVCLCARLTWVHKLPELVNQSFVTQSWVSCLCERWIFTEHTQDLMPVWTIKNTYKHWDKHFWHTHMYTASLLMTGWKGNPFQNEFQACSTNGAIKKANMRLKQFNRDKSCGYVPQTQHFGLKIHFLHFHALCFLIEPRDTWLKFRNLGFGCVFCSMLITLKSLSLIKFSHHSDIWLPFCYFIKQEQSSDYW